MGYEIQSPVVQVWLPYDIDYFIEHNGETFGVFAKNYQEKYGIDLHDIFGLKIENDEHTIILKKELIGLNLVNGMNEVSIQKWAVSNAIHEFVSHAAQSEAIQVLVNFAFGDNTNFSYGFNISLPVKGTSVVTIDDLIVQAYEM